MAYFSVDSANLYIKYRDQVFSFSMQNASIDAIKSFMRDVHFGDSTMVEFCNDNSIAKIMYEDGIIEIKKDTWENKNQYVSSFSCSLKSTMNAYAMYNLLR